MTDGQFPPPAANPDDSATIEPAWWKKRRAKLPTWAWIGIGAFVVLIGIGAAASPPEDEDSSEESSAVTTIEAETAPTTPERSEPEPTEPTEPPATEAVTTTEAPATTEAATTTAAPTTTVPDPTIGAGTYIVGTDIQPGVYRALGYWARLDANQDIIDNGLLDDCAGILIVDPSDVYIEIGGGALPIEASRNIDPIAEGCTDGVFLVNTDIFPGRYSVTPATGDEAYWARLDGTLDIIDNDLGAGQRIVIVDPSDFALEFSRGTLAFLP